MIFTNTCYTERELHGDILIDFHIKTLDFLPCPALSNKTTALQCIAQYSRQQYEEQEQDTTSDATINPIFLATVTSLQHFHGIIIRYTALPNEQLTVTRRQNK